MILALILVAISSPSATTYVVRPDGTGDFRTIQAAVDAAEDGDVIELTDGVFRGVGNRDVLWGQKAITVRSQGGDASGCVIDCEGTSAEPHRAFRFDMTPPEATLQGLTITGGYTDYGGGILADFYASPTIIRCVFLRNESSSMGGGMVCDMIACPTLHECTFVENTALSGGAICI
jgi:hypothetical protein